MESADSFWLGLNQLPDIPEEMPTIPMPRANRRQLSKSQPVMSSPPRSPPVQPTTSGTSDNSRTNATHNDERYKKILM